MAKLTKEQINNAHFFFDQAMHNIGHANEELSRHCFLAFDRETSSAVRNILGAYQAAGFNVTDIFSDIFNVEVRRV